MEAGVGAPYNVSDLDSLPDSILTDIVARSAKDPSEESSLCRELLCKCKAPLPTSPCLEKI
jgi:hypothetical protein